MAGAVGVAVGVVADIVAVEEQVDAGQEVNCHGKDAQWQWVRWPLSN